MNRVCKTKSKRKKHCNLVDSALSCRGTGQQSWYCYTCLFVLNSQMDGTWVYTHLFLCSVSWKGLKEMILPKSERNNDTEGSTDLDSQYVFQQKKPHFLEQWLNVELRVEI